MPPHAAESQSDSEVLTSDHFHFQSCEDSDDHDKLYEAVEITGESKDTYEVRWKGNDPKTKKPWPQSWVSKGDCTEDLVLIWKTRRKERKKSKRNGCNSTTSKRISRSVASMGSTGTSDSEGRLAQKLFTHHGEKKSHYVRNGDGSLQPVVAADDGEEGEEERMVEDALSDGCHSAGMEDANDRTRNDDFEMDPRNGNLDGEKQETKGMRIMPQLPRSPSSKRRPVVPARVPRLRSKTKKSNDSAVIARSSSNRNPRVSRPPLFEQDSDSDRSLPPEWHRRPRQSDPDVISIHDLAGDVILSPQSRQRLALFDAEVMGKEMLVVGEKGVEKMNDNGGVSRTVPPTACFGAQFYNTSISVVPPTSGTPALSQDQPPSADDVKLASRSSLSRPIQKGYPGKPRGLVTRSNSRSKKPSGTSNARGTKKPLSIPSLVPSPRESGEPEPEPPKFLVDVFQDVQGSSTTPSIFPAQISSFQIQVHEKQLEIDSLRLTLDSLREQHRTEVLLEADRQRQMAELHSHWVNEKSAWENERTTLAAQTAASERSKVQAEQDREFIREQYANLSAYMTAVRDENKELKQRIKIAEEQSTEGVELIKATFQLQVANLQDDAKAWRRMAEFTMQKDIQANDDIRKHAAEVPELRLLCVRQKRSLHEARAKIEGLRVGLQEKSGLCDTLTAELEQCKKENARLHSDLNKLDRTILRAEENFEEGFKI